MKAKQQYYQNLHNPSPASMMSSKINIINQPGQPKSTGIKLVQSKLKNRRPSSGAHSKKNS